MDDIAQEVRNRFYFLMEDRAQEVRNRFNWFYSLMAYYEGHHHTLHRQKEYTYFLLDIATRNDIKKHFLKRQLMLQINVYLCVQKQDWFVCVVSLKILTLFKPLFLNTTRKGKQLIVLFMIVISVFTSYCSFLLLVAREKSFLLLYNIAINFQEDEAVDCWGQAATAEGETAVINLTSTNIGIKCMILISLQTFKL